MEWKVESKEEKRRESKATKWTRNNEAEARERSEKDVLAITHEGGAAVGSFSQPPLQARLGGGLPPPHPPTDDPAAHIKSPLTRTRKPGGLLG